MPPRLPLVLVAQAPDSSVADFSTLDLDELPGKELADRLSTDRPDLLVLYISGYAEHAVVRQGCW